MQRGLKAVAHLLRRCRFEVIPTASIEDAVLASVPTEVTLAVTASPGKGLGVTLDLAERLAHHGYRVVPHLSARLVVDRAQLQDIVARLLACGVEDVFVPAGDADPPAGRFDSALSLLVELADLGHPFGRLGITGYPESHPKIDDDVTIQSMWDKRLHAQYIVSNLCLDPATLTRWIERVRRRGIALPLHLGLSGPVDRTKLMSMASKIGVQESKRFLSGHVEWFLRLSMPGGYDPKRILARLSGTIAAPGSGVEGLHIFTFNQVAKTEQWRRSLLEQLPAATGTGEPGAAGAAAGPAKGQGCA